MCVCVFSVFCLFYSCWCGAHHRYYYRCIAWNTYRYSKWERMLRPKYTHTHTNTMHEMSHSRTTTKKIDGWFISVSIICKPELKLTIKTQKDRTTEVYCQIFWSKQIHHLWKRVTVCVCVCVRRVFIFVFSILLCILYIRSLAITLLKTMASHVEL